MINRFHNAVPSAALPNANSAAGKTKVVDDFAQLLNALAGPLPQQQQASSELLEEIQAKPELHNPAMPFERIVDTVEEIVNPSTSYLFLTAPMPGAAAIFPSQNLLSPTHGENHLPRVIHESEVAILQIPPENSAENIHAAEYSSRLSPLQPLMHVIPVSQLPMQPPIDRVSPANAALQSAASQEIVVNAGDVFDQAVISLETSDSSDSRITGNKYPGVPGADVEMVIVPWRLQANAALSYKTTARRLQNIDDSEKVLTTPIHAALTSAGNHNSLLGLPSKAPAFEAREMEKALQFYRIAEAASTLANAYENARIQRADSRASFVMWPQRVLHWVADGDATTAWVRDYQLDDSGTRTLVVALRCFAEQQGFSLRRIMLNGHEAWRSPSTF